MNSLIQIVSEAHILFTLVIEFSIFALAYFTVHSKKNEAMRYTAYILPVSVILTVHILTNVLSTYKLILLAEALFFIAISILSFIKKDIKPIFLLLLGIAIGLILNYTDYLSYIADMEIYKIGLAHVLSIVIFFFADLRINGSQDSEKIHFANALATIIIMFLYTQDGAFFMLATRIFYFIVLFRNVIQLSKIEKLELEKKYKSIKEDFDEAVRKEVKSQIFYMELSKKKMAEIAMMDDLTKVYNKKTILNLIKENIQDKRMSTFSLLIFDIDNFKHVNDTLGHIQGDKCIVELAQMAKDCLRDNDKVGRYGGDEFFAIITGANLHMAVQVAERLRKRVESTENPHYTISIGISNYPNDAENVKDLIKHADDGLYIAKNKGKNSLGYLNKKN